MYGGLLPKISTSGSLTSVRSEECSTGYPLNFAGSILPEITDRSGPQSFDTGCPTGQQNICQNNFVSVRESNCIIDTDESVILSSLVSNVVSDVPGVSDFNKQETGKSFVNDWGQDQVEEIRSPYFCLRVSSILLTDSNNLLKFTTGRILSFSLHS